MLPALLSLIAAGVPAASCATQVPTLSTIPTAIAHEEVPTCLEFTPTHFAARSHSEGNQWLVFASGQPGMQRVLRLPPHAEVLFPIVAGAAEGVSVEVLYRTEAGTLVASGAITCEVEAPRTVFLTSAQSVLRGWLSTKDGAPLDRAGVDRCSETSRLAEQLRALPTAHVPVPAPGEHRKRDKSRPLERKKLPPI